jgi:molybdenum cofactor cytidylyltransferase
MKLINLNLFNKSDIVAWVGAGGKSTLIFTLARTIYSNCVISTSTHLGSDQLSNANNFTEIYSDEQLKALNLDNYIGTHLITGPKSLSEPTKVIGFNQDSFDILFSKCKEGSLPIFIEADGSKNKPLKAPADHEPAIPKGVNKVCVVVGLSVIGKKLTQENVHRPEILASLINKSPGSEITWNDIYELLSSEYGSLKSIPDKTEKYLFLHQSDFINNKTALYTLAMKCKAHFDHVLISNYNRLEKTIEIDAHFGKVGCIILAAGESKRFGSPKQLAIWKNQTFIENTLDEVSKTCLKPIVVVTGAYHELIQPYLGRYQNIVNLYNRGWKLGQSSSVKTGLLYLKDKVEAIIFLLVDQPQIDHDMINKVIISYACGKRDIILHKYKEENRHPVLFSHNTFSDLLEIHGDSGGKQLFNKFIPFELIIDDPFLALDFDSSESLNNESEFNNLPSI